MPTFCFVLSFFLFTFTRLEPSMSRPYNNLTDLESLLAFKTQLTSNSILNADWRTNTSFCQWTGISCSHRRQRVTSIDLNSFSLQGTISSHLANLSFLSYVDLSNNSLTGPIPKEITQLPRLAVLGIEYNYLTGSIPSRIFNMSSLITISLVGNNLTSSLPPIANQSRPRLQQIRLSENFLTGEIPSSFARCKDLQVLALVFNEFSGHIPSDLGSLLKLKVLFLGGNQLEGNIPTSLGNLTNLEELDLSWNNLAGGIPRELGNLVNLQSLHLYANRLTGFIPSSLPNASKLSDLDLTANNLTGSIPTNLGMSMQSLNILRLGENQLTGGLDFITSLYNCKDLVYLKVLDNELESVIPNSVGNLSMHLQRFYLGGNRIEGNIPSGIGNLSNLFLLDLGINELTGTIPLEVTKLQKLQVMYLAHNKLRGPIPSELSLITSLNYLQLEHNALSGPIPDSLGNISGLQHLSLASNALSSSIPQNFWSLRNLVELDLSKNNLNGSLPLQVKNLKVLATLDLSKNWLSSSVPSDIGELQMVSYLDFSDNSLDGQIPQKLGGLISLEYLNLSYNLISGAIPKSLANLPILGKLDLSFNKLKGQIPEGRVFSNLSIPSLMGNTKLCGAPRLRFPPCLENHDTSHSRKRLYFLRYVIPAIASVVILTAFLIYLIKFIRRSQSKKPDSGTGTPCLNHHRLISYHELVHATDNFSEANLLGRGSFGSVFKACLDDGLVVAVKVLDLKVEGASRSFDAECQALSTVRHRNLVKIVTTCSNLDFKALVLEYMPNGSFEKWLHCPNYNMNLIQRMNILIDVSVALEYLHHHHPDVVVHCDLKPSNILLEENMTAHVGDFGIAKLLFGDSKSIVSASTPGTIGYIAPEYGSTGKVSRKGDVYSFGIVILETFTRKKPTDSMFNGELSLRQWASNAYPSAVLEIVDYYLLRDDSIDEQQSDIMAAKHQCLSSIIELGLLCSKDLPKERISMKDVASKLQKMKLDYLSKFPSV